MLTGECELRWASHFGTSEMICVEATRICCGIYNYAKVWNTDTGQCERTLEGYDCALCSVVLMQDGRLCCAFELSTIKLWNRDTGECEKTLKVNTNQP